MKNLEFINTRGTVTRHESLVPITYKILENTTVAEIRDPYPNYYGAFPERPRPNSLFLFTKKFYTLDEVQQITCEMKDHLDENDIDVASAVINFVDNYHYAIRINDFIHYEHIKWLQKCYADSGVVFQRKVRFGQEANVTIFKFFNLLGIDEGIFRDARSAHEGYVVVPGRIDPQYFQRLMDAIRHNVDCELFDAAAGTFELGAETVSMIRVYAEQLKTEMLTCIREKYLKLTVSEELIEGGGIT